MHGMVLVRLLAALCLWAPALLPAQPGPSVPRAEHPRPDFQRANWLNLNGAWDFRFDPDDLGIKESWWEPGKNIGARKIIVPFCWESSLSGLRDKSGQKIGWYRRTFSIPAEWRGNHAWLRFDAVDWEARVWVNGKELGSHAGGYTPFEFDLAGVAEPGQEATVVVRVFDATDPELPRGKQTPGWYTYTSGIWQTVWLEARPARYISRFSLTPRRAGEQWFVDLEAEASGPEVSAPLRASSPQAGIEAGEIRFEGGVARASLEVKNPKLWTPDTPQLYDLTLRLEEDTVQTYFGLWAVAATQICRTNRCC
jgi:beta-galactosidase/beta-glucuronidase